MLYVASYYKVRNLCHSLKKGDLRAIDYSARLLSKFIEQSDCVIPMPSHEGHSTYMLKIANLIKNIKGCQVLDILSSPYHEPWYNTKKKQGIKGDLGYEFTVNPTENAPERIFVIDNVYSSGKTMKSALETVHRSFPNSEIEGIVIGYVDEETIKRLNYNENLQISEGRIAIPQNTIYEKYYFENKGNLFRLVKSLLLNPNEGAILHSPKLRSSGVDDDGDYYLRYERYAKNGKAMNDVVLNDDSLIDFRYLSKILKRMLNWSDKFQSYFDYNIEKAELSFVHDNKDHYKKDAYGNILLTRNKYGALVPVNNEGQHLFRYGTTKSPIRWHDIHNSPSHDIKKSRIAWDHYFYPEFLTQDRKKTARSVQTAGGQFPLHWFPKIDNEDLDALVKMICSVITSSINYKDKVNVKNHARLIAFLTLIDDGNICGYEYFSNPHKFTELDTLCDKEIGVYDHIEDNSPQNIPHIDLDALYNRPLEPEMRYDTEGNAYDADMDYMVNRIGESLNRIIKESILKVLTKNPRTTFK